MIDPNEIQAGDLVIIQDAKGNVISGSVVTVDQDRRNGLSIPDLAIQAFGFFVLFAKYSSQVNAGYELVPGITLIEHQGAMVPNAELYIRSKAQLQRNKHLRSNPT